MYDIELCVARELCLKLPPRTRRFVAQPGLEHVDGVLQIFEFG